MKLRVWKYFFQQKRQEIVYWWKWHVCISDTLLKIFAVPVVSIMLLVGMFLFFFILGLIPYTIMYLVDVNYWLHVIICFGNKDAFFGPCFTLGICVCIFGACLFLLYVLFIKFLGKWLVSNYRQAVERAEKEELEISRSGQVSIKNIDAYFDNDKVRKDLKALQKMPIAKKKKVKK
jgi:lipopolysaccharide export LptBFGC system permease protein LptF